MHTPRQVKLYENAVMFSVPMLFAEVNVVDLLLLEGVRTFFPEIYITIRDNQNLFLNNKSINRSDKKVGIDAKLENLLDSTPLNVDERELFRKAFLNKLFPRISGTGYGEEWDRVWYNSKRLCSAEYFSYGVPTGDVADKQINEVLAASTAQDSNKLRTQLLGVAKQSAWSACLRKLRAYEANIAADAALSLIKAVAETANTLPREPSAFFKDWTITQAAVFTCNLAKRLPTPESRLLAIQAAVRSASSFVYVAEILRFGRRYEKDGEILGFLSPDELSTLNALNFERLLAAAGDAALYRFLDYDTAEVLLPFAWHGGAPTLPDVLETSLRSEGPDGAEAFLRLMTGRAWEMESGVPHVADLRRDTYASIALLVDPEIIVGMLRERYGATVDVDSYPFGNSSGEAVGKRLAQQFVFVHTQHNQKPISD